MGCFVKHLLNRVPYIYKNANVFI